MAWGLGVFSDEPKLCRHDPGAGSSTGGTGRVGSWERHGWCCVPRVVCAKKNALYPAWFLIYRS